MKVSLYIPPIEQAFKILTNSQIKSQLYGGKFTVEIVQQEESYIIIKLLGKAVYVIDKLTDEYINKGHLILIEKLTEFVDATYKEGSIKWIKHPSLKKIPFEEFKKLNLKEKSVASWNEAFFFRISKDENTRGLREPQIGALHAIHSCFTTSESNIQTVVLPTGTGKTETMLATVVSKSIKTCLVVVPSDALRGQIFAKFTKLGILRELNVINEDCLNPVVCSLKNKPSSEQLTEILNICNVIVTTISIAGVINNDLQKLLADKCDILIFDEAHHEAAPKWRGLSNLFKEKNIIQFTATPYRNDKKDLQGKIVYNFSLKRAYELEYFSKINFESICIFDQKKADKTISEKAIKRLREDILNGFNHLLMVRVQTIDRATEVFELYKEYTDLKPIKINSEEENIQKIKDDIIKGNHKIIICVNMLGEGFDLPELKIAAMHDNHQSLPIFLQFIGRFARNRKDLGEAYVIANIDNDKISEELEDIWNSTDWNHILALKSSQEIQKKIEFQDFLNEYQINNEDFPIQSLRPTLSTVIYDVRGGFSWKVNEITPHIQGAIIYKKNIPQKKTFICITEIRSNFDWIDNNDLIEKSYNLYVFHVDEDLKLLFVSGNSDKSDLRRAVAALCDKEVPMIKGENIFRCFSGVNRMKLTNIGLYTALLKGLSYMLYMGGSVFDQLSDTQKTLKSKANFFGNGYEAGKRITIGCSKKGRVWSFSHDNLLNYTTWCNNIGKKILDDTITEEYFLKGFLIPEKLSSRPNLIPIAADWSGDVYDQKESSKKVTCSKGEFILIDLDLVICKFDTTLDLEFGVEIENQLVGTFKQTFIKDDVEYIQISGQKIFIEGQEITSYFNEVQPRIWFDDSSYLEGNYLFKVRINNNEHFFADDKIETIDWLGVGVDITSESQGFDAPKTESIQYYMIKKIENNFDLIFNDDDSREIADIVAIKVLDKSISVHLYHCKFSKEDRPNSAIDNFYEVCGQAQKCIRKIENQNDFFKQLKIRESSKNKSGKTRIVKGDYTLLNKIQNQGKILPVTYQAYIVQPGLTHKKITDDIRLLLGNTELFLKETHSIPLTLICSP